MNTTKTTKRENLESLTTLLTAAQEANIEGFDYDALSGYVANEIVLLDKKAEAAKARAAKNKAEGDPLRQEIFDLLNTTDFTTIRALVKAIDREDVTAQKITPRLAQLINLKQVEKSEISIEGEDGKTSKVKGYRIIAD